jgi:GNAT superfamily N-acetyltransferase
MNGTLIAPPAAAPRPDLCLPSGITATGRFQVRAAGPQDAGAIREFVCGLSVQTQYFRFFTAVSPPSAGLMRALAGGTARSDILIVTDEHDAVVGHGMAVDTDTGIRGTTTTDIGLVITDSWQGQGLGTMLLRLLAERAAQRAVAALVFEVLPGNTRMRAIIHRIWPDAQRTRNPDAITFTAPVNRSPGLVLAEAPPARSQGGRHEHSESAA